MIRLPAVLAFLAAAVLCGCPGDKVCVPNEQLACACQGGGVGAQTCDGTGAVFSSCDCSNPPTACEVPEAPACAHGACVVNNGLAGCACADGYAGVLCGECAAGFQDHDGDGSCRPSCTASTCGPHQVCSDETGETQCACAAAYADDGGACAFTAPVKDPSFSEGSEAWRATDGGTVSATATGNADPGVANLSESSACTAGAVAQTVELPPLLAAEPLRLTLDTKTYCSNGSCVIPQNPVITLNGMLGRLVPSFGWSTRSVCLGERAFGGAHALSLRMEPLTSCTTPRYGASFDNVRIQPDPTCPSPGEVFNGTFEQAEGWTRSGGATIAPKEGSGGTGGLSLEVPTLCTDASAEGAASFPLQGGNALEFKYSGTAGAELQVALDGWTVTRLTATAGGLFVPARVCIPEALKGTAPNLAFTVPQLGGSCGAPDGRKVVVDDVRVVDDPACGPDASVVNGTFEQTDIASNWDVIRSSPAAGAVEPTTLDARNGARSLRLLVKDGCATVEASTLLTVPAPKDNAGPALRYWYRYQGSALTAKTNIANAPIPLAATWTLRTECLPRPVENIPFHFTVSAYTSGACGTPVDQALFIDDVQVLTDAACPAP